MYVRAYLVTVYGWMAANAFSKDAADFLDELRKFAKKKIDESIKMQIAEILEADAVYKKDNIYGIDWNEINKQYGIN